MPKPRVYIETTIPSAYYTDRSDPVMVARRDWTRRWWEKAVMDCELVTSAVVQRELLDGRSGHVPARLALLRGVELVEVTSPVRVTARTYVLQKLMPANPPTDALHLALASHYKCDVLATWNYRHLANAHKFDRIRRLNVQLGLWVPVLTTPIHLLGEYDEPG
jgi:predicted nucleic acid-binding protein